MNVWPLLHRELLVGSRRRSTRWTRMGVAVTAFLFGAMYLISVTNVGGMGVGSMGSGLFQVLVSMAFVVTGLFGVFFAADAVSSERREGTLGLLFLTRLRGRDVVFGKLTSTSLRSAYALMGGLPVMALPIILGGVTFRGYAYSAIVLANTLFLSVSAGLLVSSFNRKPVRAVMMTLLLVLSIAGIPLIVDTARAGFDDARWETFASYLSPAYAIGHALVASSSDFLWGVLIQHIVGWLFLAVAAVGASRFTEKTRKPSRFKAARWLLSSGETKATRRLRGERPIQWLTSQRSRGPTIMGLVVTGIVGVMLAWHGPREFGSGQQTIATVGVQIVSALFTFITLVWIAVESTRQTGEARKSGAFELLLATPLTTKEVVTGMARGIWRIFAVAIFALLLVGLISTWATLVNLYENLGANSNAAGITTNSGLMWYVGISSGFGLINMVASAFALIWVGLWVGIKSDRSTPAAAAITFVGVIILPSFLVSFAFGIFSALSAVAFGGSLLWLTALLQGLAALVFKVGFIVWARRRLFRHFREAANGTLAGWRRKKATKNSPAPPPLPSVPAAGVVRTTTTSKQVRRSPGIQR